MIGGVPQLLFPQITLPISKLPSPGFHIYVPSLNLSGAVYAANDPVLLPVPVPVCVAVIAGMAEALYRIPDPAVRQLCPILFITQLALLVAPHLPLASISYALVLRSRDTLFMV